MIRDSIEEYLALCPYNFRSVRRMLVSFADDGVKCIELDFVRHGTESPLLCLCFEGVARILLPGDYVREFRSVDALTIEDIRSWGWDRLNYKVYGNEMDGAISFFCRSFSCELVDTVT